MLEKKKVEGFSSKEEGLMKSLEGKIEKVGPKMEQMKVCAYVYPLVFCCRRFI